MEPPTYASRVQLKHQHSVYMLSLFRDLFVTPGTSKPMSQTATYLAITPLLYYSQLDLTEACNCYQRRLCKPCCVLVTQQDERHPLRGDEQHLRQHLKIRSVLKWPRINHCIQQVPPSKLLNLFGPDDDILTLSDKNFNTTSVNISS